MREQMEVCLGSVIGTWGTLCRGGCLGKAAGFLKDESRDDDRREQERYSSNVGRRREESCSAQGLALALNCLSHSSVSPFRPVVQVNFGPCAALVQQRALGDNPAQFGPSLPLLSSPQ